MFLNFDTNTLEKLSEGVVVLDRYGQIIDFNRAAKPWIKSCVKAADKIRAIVIQAARDGSKTPVLIDLYPKADAQTQAADVMLCSDGKDGFALLFTPVHCNPQESPGEWQRQGISHLIGDEIRHQLNQLIQHLGSIRDPKSVAETTPVREHAQHLRSLFVAMEQLSLIARAGTMFPGERLSVVELLRDAIASINFRHCDYFIEATAPEPATEVGPIYGSAKWVKCAFVALLESLEQWAPRRSHIFLNVRQNGGFLVLTARPSSISDVSSTIPVKPEADVDPVLRLAASIRVPLARRIVELHGGQLRVNTIDGDDAKASNAIESFTLQLPTGSPGNQRSKDCENCSVNQQAMAYARDLVSTMPSLSRDAEVSDEEHAFLMHVTHTN
jgi:hypothetical protein